MDTNLQQLVQRVGPLDYKLAARDVEEVARQLADLHCHGQLHADVRPANIVLDEAGSAGLATPAGNPGVGYDDNNDVSEDEAAQIADYLAPERALNAGSADERAVIYRLGCVLFFLLVERAPFASGTISERLLMIQVGKPDAISDLRLDVSQTLARICEKMMAKKPSDRYQSADEVIAAIAAWRRAEA